MKAEIISLVLLGLFIIFVGITHSKKNKMNTVNLNGQEIVLSKIQTITAIEKSLTSYSFTIVFGLVSTEIRNDSEDELKKTRDDLTGYLYKYYH